MTQNVEMEELQELKAQFNLINEKLGKQMIVNDRLIEDSMKQKMSYVDSYYKQRFMGSFIAVPIVVIIFAVMKFHWGFIALTIFGLLVQVVVDLRCYRALNTKRIVCMDLISATECVMKFKKLRAVTDKILIAFMIPLALWAVAITMHYTWDIDAIIRFVIFMTVAIVIMYRRDRKLMSRLDEILEQIKELKG